MPSLDIRQAQLPGCVIACIGTVDLGTCSSLLDNECICRSTSYQEDLASCFAFSCAASDAAIGQEFGAERCAAIGITITAQLPSATASITGPSLSETGMGSPTSVAVTGTPSSWLEPPVLYTQTLVNVQAVMSSICGALLLAAILLGIFSCRARIKNERGQTASQWSGAGTFGDQTKFEAGASRFGVSRPGQTDTFVSDHRQTVSFGAASNHLPYERPALAGAAVGAGGGRFTNRMAVDEEDEPQEEQWEMRERIEPASPTASSSGQRHTPQEDDADEDEDEDEDKKEQGQVEELPVPTPSTAVSGMNDDDHEVGTLHVLEKHGRAF